MATLCGEAANVNGNIIDNGHMVTSQQISTSNCLDENSSQMNSYTDNRTLNLAPASITEGTFFIANPPHAASSSNPSLSINSISAADCSSYEDDNLSSQQQANNYPFTKNLLCEQQRNRNRNIATSCKKLIESEFSTPSLHFALQTTLPPPLPSARNMDEKMKMQMPPPAPPSTDMNNFIRSNEIQESSTSSSRSILENTNALKLALNLSLYGLNEISAIPKNHRNEDELSICQIMQMNSLSENSNSVEHFSTKLVCSQHLNVNPMIDERSKKSQNMTECVPVPSSEHVAEIVGRQGCKIKALRAKTNTYIKTPVRGEEPVFVVTGRKEDVAKAKQEILSAADHFSLIRASRKTSLDEASCGNLISNSNGRNQAGAQLQPGQVTIQVRVPYRVVGLVVGPKGATIKHIQQETHTYIVTPSREREPVFEVTGTPENVQTAQRQIESHIALRTGVVNNEEERSPPIMNHSDLCQREDINALKQSKAESIEQDILIKLCRRGISSALSYIDNQKTAFANSPNCSNESNSNEKRTEEKFLSIGTAAFSNQLPVQLQDLKMANFKQNDDINEKAELYQSDKIPQKGVPKVINERTGKEYECVNIMNCQNIQNKTNNFSTSSNITSSVAFNNSCSSASSTASSRSACKSGDARNNPKCSTRPELVNIWQNIKDSLDIDEGIEETSNNWTLTSHSTNINESHGSPTASTSPADSLLGDLTFSSNNYIQNNNVSNSTLQLKPYSNLVQQECLVCNKNSISAALVPCGHNVFCIDCANRICSSLDASCPICSLTVYHAIRLLV